MTVKKETKTQNAQYDDGFPTEDNPTKIEETGSKDSGMPFDSGRKSVKRDFNSSGTTLNDKHPFKNK